MEAGNTNLRSGGVDTFGKGFTDFLFYPPTAAYQQSLQDGFPTSVFRGSPKPTSYPTLAETLRIAQASVTSSAITKLCERSPFRQGSPWLVSNKPCEPSPLPNARPTISPKEVMLEDPYFEEYAATPVPFIRQRAPIIITDDTEVSQQTHPNSSVRDRPAPERNSDGEFRCSHDDCSGESVTFRRMCEWNKHMDKHDRPYKCTHPECENLHGFTYSGGLLRHKREVHQMHQLTGTFLHCPYSQCNRGLGGVSFPRREHLREHLEEHLRRLHGHNVRDDQYAAKSSTRVRSYLPIVSENTLVNALPDTGAWRNIMSLEHAQKIGAVIDRAPGKRHEFVNAVGGTFQAIGEVRSSIRFADSTSSPEHVHSLVFSVLESASSPIILGRRFLQTTLSLGKYKHRLVKLATNLSSRVFRLMYLESTAQRLRCQLDSEDVLASVDTGSDVDLISLDYAIARGWNRYMNRDPTECGTAILSDGTTIELDGCVDRNIDVGHDTLLRRFYVLKGLTCDVLLGDDTLDRLDLWNRHTDTLIDVEYDQIADFHNIEWRERLNEIDQEVEALVSRSSYTTPGALPVQVNSSGKASFLRGMFKAKQNTAKGELMQQALWQRLYKADTIEDEESRLAISRIAVATGDALRQEVSLNQERHRRWSELRSKIIALRKRVRPDGSLSAATSV